MSTTSKQLERLKTTQRVLFNEAIKIEKHKISLFEAPTGFGKSVLVNTIAEYLASEDKKKIIIVTATNHLAIEQLNLFKNEKFEFLRNLEIDLVVGKENYFAVKNISNEVYKYINKEQLDNYIENVTDNNGFLIDSLFENVDIEEPNKKIVRGLICLKDSDREHLSDFEELDISITNYSYLFTSVFFRKDFDISNYVVIADEVHQLMENVENILTNSFSIFRYRNLLTSILNNLPKNTDKLKNMILNIIDNSDSLLNKYSNSSHAGSSYSLNEIGYNFIDDLKEKIISKEAFIDDTEIKDKDKDKKTKKAKDLNSLLKEAIEKSDNDSLKLNYKLYKSEKSELFGIINTPQDVTVYMSPSKGYPTLNASKGDVRGWLLTFFWDKVESFIGLSATIKANENDEQAFNRLGINRATFEMWLDKVETIDNFVNLYKRFPTKEDKEYLKLVDFLDTQKKGYVEGFLTQEKEQILIKKFGISFFSGLIKSELKSEEKRVTHIKYGVRDFAPIFEKKQARTFLPSKDLIKPVINDEENENIWFDMITKSIVDNFENKNSLVLCGSFHEVETISEILKDKLPNTNIISAKRNTPTTQIIEEFKSKGGIAVVTRNYGTGVNLPREQLEKLFIIKLPFPIFTTKKWVDVKMYDKKFNTSFYHSLYQNEMFTVFRQWIGRLIRTEEDRGDLYILDSRYWDVKNQKTLEYWISKMSIIQSKQITYESENNEIKSLKSESMVEKINNFTHESFTDNLKEYLISNKEYISKYKKLPLSKEANSLELNKALMKIKKDFEIYIESK